jgi:hypothetical protein
MTGNDFANDMLKWLNRLSQETDPAAELAHILKSLGLDRPEIETIASRILEITRTVPPADLLKKRYASVISYLIWAYCGPLAPQAVQDLYGEDWVKNLPPYAPRANDGF